MRHRLLALGALLVTIAVVAAPASAPTAALPGQRVCQWQRNGHRPGQRHAAAHDQLPVDVQRPAAPGRRHHADGDSGCRLDVGGLGRRFLGAGWTCRPADRFRRVHRVGVRHLRQLRAVRAFGEPNRERRRKRLWQRDLLPLDLLGDHRQGNLGDADRLVGGGLDLHRLVRCVFRHRLLQLHDGRSKKNVTATFSLPQTPRYELTVSKAGTGTGTVSGDGINCGSTCTASYPQGTSVTVAATPAADSSFVGWGGACLGTGSCTVRMDAAASVTASFDLRPPPPPNKVTLTVKKVGAQDVVVGGAGGINCGPNCSADVVPGTKIALVASAAGGSRFAGWSAMDCGTVPVCTVEVDAPTVLNARFEKALDIARPKVKAFAVRARRGGVAKLRYRVDDAGGGVLQASGTILSRSTVLAQLKTRRTPDHTISSFAWKVPRPAAEVAASSAFARVTSPVTAAERHVRRSWWARERTPAPDRRPHGRGGGRPRSGGSCGPPRRRPSERRPLLPGRLPPVSGAIGNRLAESGDRGLGGQQVRLPNQGCRYRERSGSRQRPEPLR